MKTERNRISVEIGARIRTLRNERKLSQEDLALASGIHPAYLGRVERGEKCPSIDTVCKISDGLKVAPAELFNFAGDGSHAKENALKRIEKVFSELSDESAIKLASIIEQLSDFHKL